MFEFSWPWLWCLLPLPLLLVFTKPKQPQAATLVMPGFRPVQQPSTISVKRRVGLSPVAWLFWSLLVAAATRPQWLGEPVAITPPGRDIMLAVDLSGSMQYEDMVLNGRYVDRLTMVKSVLNDFIQARQGDRLGLILFADTAFLQTPITSDLKTVQTMLDEAVLGLIGEKTAIGDAIGLAAKRFQDTEQQQKILILLTDGQNTAGSITPEQALILAKDQGMTIFTIGVASDSMQVPSLFGMRNVATQNDLDERLLTDIAKQTNGQYFRARDKEQLEQIYQLLNELEPIAKDQQYYRPQSALFYLPLAAAGAVLVLLMLWRSLQLWQRTRLTASASHLGASNPGTTQSRYAHTTNVRGGHHG